jgi:hypothetical protein
MLSYDKRQDEGRFKLTLEDEDGRIKIDKEDQMDETVTGIVDPNDAEGQDATPVKDVGTTIMNTKKRGRPMLSAGTTVTRKNGNFTKGEDGKWHKTV